LHKAHLKILPQSNGARARSSESKKLYITFDIEDIKSPDAPRAILFVLRNLRRYHLKGLFFITGEMLLAISANKSLLKMFDLHEIGYHSSLHTRRPTIQEYTDIQDYEEAVRVSIAHESGPTGLEFLRETFREKEINAFRAPRLAWSPAHITALYNLGIRFDFSTCVSNDAVNHRGVTFFPRPIEIDRIYSPITLARVMKQLLTRQTVVLDLHPSVLMYKGWWDWEFMHPDISPRYRPKPRSSVDMAVRLVAFRVFFFLVRVLTDIGVVEVTPKLKSSLVPLRTNTVDVAALYRRSISASLWFVRYRPANFMRHLTLFLSTGQDAP
jgi:hypothetical protein